MTVATRVRGSVRSRNRLAAFEARSSSMPRCARLPPMFEVHANENFQGSLDDVFAVLSDHEQFLRGPDIERSIVSQPGTPERNGLGAVREVFSGPFHFVEEVVRFEPPHRYDYRIRSVTMFGRPFPLEHELGWLELQDTAGLVRVDWFSRFRLALPVVGKWAEPPLGRKLAGNFSKLLEQAKRSLAA